MERIIDPIDRDILKKELSQDCYLRTTRKGSNEIYAVNIHNAPNVLKEIGRLREVTFRASGGGTGMEIDLDEYDTSENCYQQLIVWSPEDEEIIGGYRFILCKNVLTDSEDIQLSTSHYFDFTDRFVSVFLPNTIELGRSWVQPNFQPAVNPRKGLFARRCSRRRMWHSPKAGPTYAASQGQHGCLPSSWYSQVCEVYE